MKIYTFQEAVELLKKDYELGDAIVYDVKIDRHLGDLLTVKYYKLYVDSGGFSDYDGYGRQYTEDGKYLDNTRPSDVEWLDPLCAYVLWFNK